MRKKSAKVAVGKSKLAQGYGLFARRDPQR